MSTGEWLGLIGLVASIAGGMFGWILLLHGRISRSEARLDNLEHMRDDMRKIVMYLMNERGEDK